MITNSSLLPLLSTLLFQKLLALLMYWGVTLVMFILSVEMGFTCYNSHTLVLVAELLLEQKFYQKISLFLR